VPAFPASGESSSRSRNGARWFCPPSFTVCMQPIRSREGSEQRGRRGSRLLEADGRWRKARRIRGKGLAQAQPTTSRLSLTFPSSNCFNRLGWRLPAGYFFFRCGTSQLIHLSADLFNRPAKLGLPSVGFRCSPLTMTAGSGATRERHVMKTAALTGNDWIETKRRRCCPLGYSSQYNLGIYRRI
jgi:hypothetical protein